MTLLLVSHGAFQLLYIFAEAGQENDALMEASQANLNFDD